MWKAGSWGEIGVEFSEIKEVDKGWGGKGGFVSYDKEKRVYGRGDYDEIEKMKVK